MALGRANGPGPASEGRRYKAPRLPIRPIRLVFFSYLALVAAATVLAAVRLNESTAMPGLAAIEVIILGLPWSFALGIERLSRFGGPGMVAIAFLGVALNAFLLWKTVRLFEPGAAPDS